MKLGDLPDIAPDAMLLAIRSELVAQRAAFVHLLDLIGETGGPSAADLAARIHGKTISFPSGAIDQAATITWLASPPRSAGLWRRQRGAPS